MRVKINGTNIMSGIAIFSLLITLAIIGVRFYYKDIDQISYHNRTYNLSLKQEIEGNLKLLFDTTVPTGKYYKGMEIYDLENNPYDSTIIFLKTRGGTFLTYSLSGGP